MGSFLEILAQYLIELLPWRVTDEFDWGVHSRLGARPKTPLKTGLVLHIPGIHTYYSIPKRPQVIPLRTQSMMTKNGVSVVFSGTIVIEVTDPIAMIFEVHDFKDAVVDFSMTHLAERVHELTVENEQEVDLKSLERSLKGTLETRLRDWGAKVHKAGFTDFVPTQHQVRLFQDPLRSGVDEP